jgi:protein ImuB
MALTVAAMAGVAYAQMSRWTASEEPMGHEQALGEFLDRLEGRFVKEGRAALWAELVESHVPERAFRLRAGHEGAAHGRGGSSPSPSPSPSPRPPLLRREPQPIEVMAVAPEGPLVWLRCGRRAAAIVASIGPERIAWEWWREERRTSRFYGTRDYYAVQDEHGRWLWVYRHVPTNTWFLHGEWA